MIKIIFNNTIGEKIATIKLDLENRKIDNIKIEDGKSRIAKIYYPEIEKPSYDSLESIINYYCDTKNKDLRLLLEHIKENGFYTPYRPNLRIIVER